MTEKDARTKWCPMVRVGFYSNNGVVQINRHPMDTFGDGDEGVKSETRCIASDCAMWRKLGDESGHEGFCGLAGL